jgi:hypothetical protein
LTPTLGPFLLRRTSRFGVGGEYCCPSLSHTLDPHPHTSPQQHPYNYYYGHLGQHQSTGVRPTGRITSHHISRHIRAAAVRYLLRIPHYITDGRTPRRYSFLRFKAFSLHKLHFFGQKPDGTADQKSCLLCDARAWSSFVCFVCFKYPYALFYQRYSNLPHCFLALSTWSGGDATSAEAGALGGTRSGGIYTLTSLN